MLAVKGIVMKRLNKSGCLIQWIWLIILAIIQLFFGIVKVPVLQEHYAEGINTLTAYNHGGVFPISETRGFVDIFISQINAANNSGFAVNNYNFAVVTIVQTNVQMCFDGIENSTFYAQTAQFLLIIMGQSIDTAEIIEHHAYINPGDNLGG